MLFKVQDPSDTMACATLREECFRSLKQIEQERKSFLAMCENRDHLKSLSHHERNLVFGHMFMMGEQLSRGGNFPGPNAAVFLKTCADPEFGMGVAARLARRVGLSAFARHGNDLREELAAGLSQWPDFDEEAFRAGRDQPDDFIAEFTIDFYSIRQIAFEVRRIFVIFKDVEQSDHRAFRDLVDIHDSFRMTAMGPVTQTQIEELTKSAKRAACNSGTKVPDRDRDEDPEMA